MKSALKILSAFAVILVTLVLSDYAFGKLTDITLGGKIKSKQEYMITQKDDSEIVFIGSSRAHRHYDAPYITDSLGIKAFNAGEDGRGLTFQLPLLTKYLQRNHPKVVVLEMSASIDGKWNDRIGMLYPLANKCTQVIDVSTRIDGFNQYYLKSNLYRYNSNLVNELRNSRHPFKLLPNRGFDPVSIQKAPEGTFAESTRHYLEPTDSIERAILIDIINLCKERDVALVGIMSPIYANIERRYEIDSIFAQYKVPLIDNMGYRLPLSPNEYFKDQTHLNVYGARAYTKHIMQQLRDSLMIFNQRKDIFRH